MYVGLTPDKRFLPGHLGMGLVEGEEGAHSSSWGDCCPGCYRTLLLALQVMTPWAMRCPSLTSGLSWKLI